MYRATPRRGAQNRSTAGSRTRLIELPTAITGEVDDPAYHSLAACDLERGEGTGLPSGESVARALGVKSLRREDLGLDRYGWVGGTQLWLYVLRESAVQHGGEQLGTVGGRIVGEVLVGISSNDPESYLAVDPNWTPTLPRHESSFRLRDLLIPLSCPGGSRRRAAACSALDAR
jgi:hypothetical protein